MTLTSIQALPSSSSSPSFLLVGFPVHEFSHAFAAYRLGDWTAAVQGRLTLNPIVHFDPLGGIAAGPVSASPAGFFIRLGEADAGQPL